MPSALKSSWIALLATIASVPVVVGTIPFGNQFMLAPFSSPAVTILGVGVGISAAFWAVALANKQVSLRWHGALWGMVALIAFLGLATIFGKDPSVALMGDGEDLNGLITYALCAAACLLVVAHCTDTSCIKTLNTTVVSSGLVVAVIALLGQLFTLDVFNEVPAAQAAELGWMISQGASTLGNPNFTGSFLVIPAALAFYRAMSPLKNNRNNYFDIAAAGVIMAALVFTLTRAAWIALAVAISLTFAIVTMRAHKVPKRVQIANALGIIALTVSFPFIGSDLLRRVADLGSDGLMGLMGRSIIWGEALDVIAANPLLGTGPASFRFGWYGVREVSGLVVGAGAVGTDAHNLILMLAAIGGVPTALAGLYFWMSSIFASAKIVFAKKSPASRDYIAWWVAMAAAAVTLVTTMMTTALLLVLFIGLGVLLAPLATKVAAEKPGNVITRTALVGAGLFAVAGVAFGVVQGNLHASARSALLESPSAVERVAQNNTWSANIGLLAARLRSQVTLSQAQSLGADATQAAIDATYSPLSEEHPADYEVLMWWSTDLMIAGDVLGSTALLERGLTVSERAIELYPNSLVVRTNRARALFDLDRISEAASELSGFENADPSYTPTRDLLATIAQEMAD